MSITLNIDDATVARLEQAAKASGVSPSQLVARLVEQRLGSVRPKTDSSSLPPLLPPREMVCLVDLTKANELADQLEDEARLEKMRRSG